MVASTRHLLASLSRLSHSNVNVITEVVYVQSEHSGVRVGAHYILTHACLLQQVLFLHASQTLLPTAPIACPLTSSYNRLGARDADCGDTITIMYPARSSTTYRTQYHCVDATPNKLSSRLQLQALGAALGMRCTVTPCSSDYVVLHYLLPMAPHHLLSHLATSTVYKLTRL